MACAPVIAREPHGDRGLVVERAHAGDAADDGCVFDDRIAALDSVRVAEDDRRFDLAAVDEPPRAEPHAHGKHDQKEERNQLTHCAEFIDLC